MSVTYPVGFRAGAAAAGLKSSGALDVCLVINDGPTPRAAAVLTTNKVTAAPVRWTQQVIAGAAVQAVVLNSGGANACTGEQGLSDAAEMAARTAEKFALQPHQVAVCSTGLIGVCLPMEKVRAGIDIAAQNTASGATAGLHAAQAIMTTDSVPKTAEFEAFTDSGTPWHIGGMAKGAGMLAPGLATMLVVITTDALIDSQDMQSALNHAVSQTFNRLDSDGCMSTNDTVLLLSSGHVGKVSTTEFLHGLQHVCQDLMLQLQHDAEGATKDITITVTGATDVTEAEDAARTVARSALLKCAIHGNDANWGRVLAALGTSHATFDPDRVDVALNGVWVCRQSQAAAARDDVAWVGREVTIEIDLNVGTAGATVWTNDLTAMYVHENSAYSS